MRSSLRPLRTLGFVGAVLLSLAAFTPKTHQTTTPTCTSNAQCSKLGELCCNEFAYPGSPKICKPPVGGHCPLIP